MRTELEVGSGGRLELSFVQMVACEQALDVADLHANATLWVSEKAGETPEIVASGTLKSVNIAARQCDARFSPFSNSRDSGDSGNDSSSSIGPNLDALIFVSCSPIDVNRNAVAWAAMNHIPAVATGGTSVGRLIVGGVRIVGSSGGSVATTPTSKAINYAASLAGYFNDEGKKTRGLFGDSVETTPVDYEPAQFSSRPPLAAALPFRTALSTAACRARSRCPLHPDRARSAGPLYLLQRIVFLAEPPALFGAA